MKNNNVTLGMIAGLAVGTVLGILFAPAKGTETRKKIADKSTDLKDKIKDSSHKLTDKITQTISKLKTESLELTGEAKEALEEEITKLENLKDINKAMILG